MSQIVEAEIDMIVLFIKRKVTAWEQLDSPLSSLVSGELSDLAEEIETGKHWVPE